MNPVRIYDYQVLARKRLFEAVRPLSPAQYERVFAIGLGSLARTMTHTMLCEWMYMCRIRELDVPPYEQWPIRDEQPLGFPELEAAWTSQAAETRGALGCVRDWEKVLEYRVVDAGKSLVINATRSDICTQMLLHEVHHRAQAMNMLKQLGVTLEDLDYSAFMYRRRWE